MKKKEDFNKVVNIVNIVLPSSETSPAENDRKRQKNTEAEKTLYQSTNTSAPNTVCATEIHFHFRQRRHCAFSENFWSTSTDYVGFTSRHLHQRVEEHKRSTIGLHVKDEHGEDPDSIGSNFEILKKCQSKLDCLIFEMFFIRKLKPKLNKQSDSIRAKLFT